MSYFGSGSGDNDHTLDVLCLIDDFDKPKAREISSLLKELSDDGFTSHKDLEIFIGVVMFGLENKLKVPMRRLNMALNMVDELREDEDYLSGFGDPGVNKDEEPYPTRLQMLEAEGHMIYDAMQNKGVLPLEWLETVH